MKHTRLIALALTLTLSLSLLAGCSPKEDTDVTIPDVSEETVAPETDVTEDFLTTPEAGTDEMPVAPLPEEDAYVAPSGDIALSRTDFTLFTLGDSYQLTLSNLIDSDVVTFTSTNEEIATVDEEGNVTAVGAGTTTIVATILLDGITAVERTAIVRCDVELPAVEEETVPTITVADFFAQLQSDFTTASSLMMLEGEMLTGAYPGLAEVNTLQCAVYAPMMSFAALELALVEVADSADIDTVKAIFQARIDAQVAGGAWYPAAIEGWQNNSHIVTSGNYIFLVVTSGYQDGVDAPITETASEFIAAFEAAF